MANNLLFAKTVPRNSCGFTSICPSFLRRTVPSADFVILGTLVGTLDTMLATLGTVIMVVVGEELVGGTQRNRINISAITAVCGKNVK